MAEFVAAIPQYRANTVETARMAIVARGLLTEKAERHGFDFDCENRGILHIYTKKAEFDHATEVNKLLAEGGLERRTIAKQLGDRVNGYPVKGYSITVRLDDAESQRAAPWISLLDDEAKVVTSRLGKDRFRIAGTAEFNGYNLDIRDDRICPLVTWCERFFPGVSTEHAVPWAGLRPMMANMVPKVGQGVRDRVFYYTGHGYLGWTLSAVTAEMVAEKVMASRTVNASKGETPKVSRQLKVQGAV